MDDPAIILLPTDGTTQAHGSKTDPPLPPPPFKPASPPNDPMNQHDFERQLPSMRNLDESFFHNRVQNLFDRLKFDIDEAKVQIVRVDGRAQEPMANNEIRRRHAELDRLHAELSSTFRELMVLKIAVEDRRIVHQMFDEHNSKFWVAIGLYEDLLEERGLTPLIPASSQPSRSADANTPRFNVKLPDFHLPSFDGSPENWLKWKETYQSMIHANASISKVVKYHYLRAAMKFPTGQKSILENFSLSENCYDAAWAALCKRYDDPKKVRAHLFNRLLTIKKMSAETLPEVTRVIDEFSSVVTSLKLCDATYDDLLVHIVQFRLDDTTLREWQKEIRHDEQIPFDKLMNFLSDYSSVVASLSSSSVKRPAPSKPVETKPVSSTKIFTAGDGAGCVVCHESHLLHACSKFRAMNVNERHRVVNQHRLCRNCLSPKHVQRNCPSMNRCRTCKQTHHTLLHYEGNNSSEASGSRPMPVNPPSVPDFSARPQQPMQQRGHTSPAVIPFRPPSPPRLSYHPRSNFSAANFQSSELQTFHLRTEALLSTVSIYVLDAHNCWRTARALMDSGSQGNHMTMSFARELGLPLVPTRQTITGINGQTSLVKSTAEVIFASRYRRFSGSLSCFVSDDITGVLPNRRINATSLNLPRDLFLADPMFHEPGKIDMLLGTGVYHDAQLNVIIKRPDMPVLMETEFGWTLGGCYSATSSSSALTCCFTQQASSGILDLDEKIEKFIELESCGDSKKILSPEQIYCIESYNKTTHQNKAGQVVVNLPVKASIQHLKSNYENAIRQFFYQERKRLEKPEVNVAYVAYIEDLIATGRMTEVSALLTDEGYFLPHHAVEKIGSSTTKVRPVFNGSSISRSGQSLNDCLCVGPTVQPDLLEVLLRFREGKYVLKGDIEKMYLQVKVNGEQTKFQKIIWRSVPGETFKHFELNTVTFGLAPSSFLATNTLLFAARKFAERFPEAAKVIESYFYVDDFVYSFDDLQQGLRLRDEIRFILSQIHFPLRKFTANHENLLIGLPSEDIESSSADTAVLKTLGIVWNPVTDVISFVVKIFAEAPRTKADLMSQIASLFDPKGLVGPVVVTAKLHMKMTRKLKWNEELPVSVRESWESFRLKLTALNDLSIPRHAIISNPVTIALHGFSDASQEAYGAVFYLRSVDAIGNVQVSLLCSKSRVSPPKQQTVARLELCAATLMSRIVPKIIETLNCRIDEIILWSDSMITLFWIAEEPSKLSVFVGNRVSVVQDNTEHCQWRHVSTAHMPADCLSRGMKPDEINDCVIWWNGPEFLMKPPSEWPETILTINNCEDDCTKEVRKTFVEVSTHPLLTLIEARFSSLTKLINCVAFIRRLAADGSKRCQPLSLEEIEASTENVVRILQEVLLPVEYKFFLRKLVSPESPEKFPPKSQLLQLAPFMNDKRIICVGGRLQASAGISERQKHPIILPKSHFSKILIRDMHRKYLHPGNSTMLSFVRQYYWPLGAKSLIRQVKHECLTCFRVQPKFPTQIMGTLPAARVNMAPPFQSTAVDYAGPFDMRASLTKKSSIVKVYVAVFKCMATGAIHLEPVTSLSTAAFIATFDRFISRRGLSRDIFSDNGTGFVGANNEFRRILTEIEHELGEYLKEKTIKWHFTTPLAPHAGGYYEAGVKSMKHHLVRESANRSFDYEQLTTLLCKIEAVVNSRPITPMSDDPDDLEALTPAHFLVGRPLIAKPERNFILSNANLLDRFNQLQQLQQKIWQRWYHEYLHHLQTRPHLFRVVNEFHVGDMVVVKDANLPPMKWMLGRVIKHLPGKDGNVRNVVVKTKNGEKTRHIKYLAYLPRDPESPRAAGECSASEEVITTLLT